MGDLKSFRPSLRETRDKRPLGRELDRSWCHRHTTSMIKLFWSQPIAPWTSWATYGQGEKFSAYSRRESRDKRLFGRNPDRGWCHNYTSEKLSWSQPMDQGTARQHTRMLPSMSMNPWLRPLLELWEKIPHSKTNVHINIDQFHDLHVRSTSILWFLSIGSSKTIPDIFCNTLYTLMQIPFTSQHMQKFGDNLRLS